MLIVTGKIMAQSDGLRIMVNAGVPGMTIGYASKRPRGRPAPESSAKTREEQCPADFSKQYN
jgi:hypothetical protein